MLAHIGWKVISDGKNISDEKTYQMEKHLKWENISDYKTSQIGKTS